MNEKALKIDVTPFTLMDELAWAYVTFDRFRGAESGSIIGSAFDANARLAWSFDGQGWRKRNSRPSLTSGSPS